MKRRHLFEFEDQPWLPAIRAAGCGYDYWPHPVDARHVPEELPGVRTMFAAFHHFAPKQARDVLANAASDRVLICIFESTSRSVPAIISSLLVPIFVGWMTPTIRPVTLSRILFTCSVPVLPVMIWWDGLVSHLRTYSSHELRSMADAYQTRDYRWTAGEVRVSGLPVGLPYLVGMPLGGPQCAT